VRWPKTDRNVAIACAGLAVFDLLAPEVILPAITL
jgi:hypothetical protein